MWRLLTVCIVLALPARAHADVDYKRVSLGVNAIYLLLPVYQVQAEIAVNPKWSVALRGGGGVWALTDDHSRILEFGGQASHYLIGSVKRGVQVGLDARWVDFENGGMLMGLGNGFALGPFLGYKRTFASGITLAGQAGAEVVPVGKSDGPLLPYLLLTLGVAFGDAGGSPAEVVDQTAVATGPRKATRRPLDHHRGFMFAFSLGGGGTVLEDCSGCGSAKGVAVDASLGWFLHRRFALMYDANAIVGVGPFSATGMGLQSVALQYWPHESFWVKVGVGAARLIQVTVISEAELDGGGGTLAAGYEFHHAGSFAMDVQLRGSHGSFGRGDGKLGVNTFGALVGLRWH